MPSVHPTVLDCRCRSITCRNYIDEIRETMAELRRDRYGRWSPGPSAAVNPDHAWKALSLVNDWVKHAETKGAGALAVSGVIGGLLFNLIKDRHPGFWMGTAAVLTAGAALTAGVCAGISLWPRLKHTEDPTSPLYFNHIAQAHSKVDSYRTTLRLLTASPDDIVNELAGQVWANSGVARDKFTWVGRAIAAVIAAFGFLAVLVILIGLDSIGVIHGQ